MKKKLFRKNTVKKVVKKQKIENKQLKVKFNFRGIKLKLISGYLVAVLFIIALGIITYTKASNAIITNYEISMQNTIQKTGEYYQLILDTVDTKSLQISNDAIVKKYFSQEYKYDLALEAQQFKMVTSEILITGLSDNFVNRIYIFGEYGKSIASEMGLNKIEYNTYIESEEGKRVIEEVGNGVWSGYHKGFDEVSGLESKNYGITVSRQIVNTSHKPVGMVILDVDLDAMKKPLQNLQLEEGSLCTFITPDGKEISSLDTEDSQIFTGTEVYKQFMVGEEMITSSYHDYNGDPHLYILSKVGDTDFTIAMMVPEEQILEQAKDIKSITFLIVIAAILVSIIIATILSNGIGNAIHKLSTVVTAAAGGDLTTLAITKRRDEFRVLSDNLNNMLANMKNLIQKASEVSKTVIDSSKYVTNNSGKLVLSTQNITEIINNVEAGISQQADDISSCLKKMDELAGKISNVYEGAGEMEKFAANTRNIVENGITTIDELNSKAKATSEITQNVIQEIGILEQESHAIGNIINSINDIAEQTNLLSLNASIEAARAGEYGRGFAVVASEIRQLAEQSVKASSQIHEIIERIQNKTKGTVKIAKEAEVIVISQEGALKDTIHLFSDINKHVEGLIKNIEKITGDIKDIEYAKNESLDAITSISAVSQETAAAAQEVLGAVNNQMESVQNLNSAAKNLDDESKNLQESIRIFKII